MARPRLGLLFPLLLVGLAAAAIALVVDSRTRLVDSSYTIDELRVELARQEDLGRRLRLEIASLTAPGRIQPTLASLGLSPPRLDQVHLIPARPTPGALSLESSQGRKP